ncbi:MAG TPA: NAD(P)/FAD-dependent oxidoreductase [Polyangia bacterium]|nr:NAD(P)/FAD-dependent oxidoreductase [Polyangia bacterium]
MKRPWDVGIVGCGFAGAATGLLLARAGHAVTVYERVSRPGASGAGILLQPTGLAVLRELGLHEAVMARGAPVTGLFCRSSDGRALFDLKYAQLAPDLHGLGVHRGALYEALFGALTAAGARLRTGEEVTGVDRGETRPRLLGQAGPLARHDLVVVADGARSRLRDRSPALRHATPYQWGALWFVGVDAERRFGSTLSQVCLGTRHMLGFLPTGLGPGAGAAPLCSLFWSQRMDQVDEWRRRGLGPWKRDVLALEPAAAPLLEQIHDVEQILTAGYVDGVMNRVFDGHVAYVGDAAHATSPQLGQGTNLALVDAAVLAGALDREDDLDRALARYAAARRAHVAFYQLASRWLTPLFQSDLDWLGRLRDRLFPLLNRLPFLRQQMLRTLAGVRRGVLRGDLRLPAARGAHPVPVVA